MAGILAKLLPDRETLDRLGHNARARAEALYGIDQQVEATLAFYQDIVAQNDEARD